MANIIREALNATSMKLRMYCGGMSKVGVGLTGTWVGTVTFRGSYDGVNFQTLAMTPFASGTAVSTTTANGSWEVNVANLLVVEVEFTSRTSGTLIVAIGASIDSSYQDVFLASTARFVSQSVAAGAANAITIAASTNRAWRARSVSVSFDSAPAAAVLVTISDGTVLWAEYTTAAAGTYQLKLPEDPKTPGVTGGGVVGTTGNALVITCAAPGGSVVSKVNVEAHAG